MPNSEIYKIAKLKGSQIKGFYSIQENIDMHMHMKFL